MFKNNAGLGFIDQIKFMHDQGFRGNVKEGKEGEMALIKAHREVDGF